MRSDTSASGTPAQHAAPSASVLGAVGLGAALMYFLDPARGARRRGLLRDKIVHAGHVAGDALGKTRRDLRNRAQGVAAETKNRVGADENADDRVIAERVRAELGRVVSHPGAIEVGVEQGHATLRGPVLAREVDDLLSRVRGVRGVADVDNQLEVHETADDVPALQGGERREGGKFELQQENWTPAARLLTTVAGGALALYGTRRKGALGAVAGVAGVALLARGSTNQPLRRVVGVGAGRRAVDVQKTINIDAPVDEVFAFFTEWERFPDWMSHVREVRPTGRRGPVGEITRWTVDGPAGTTVSWEAEPTRLEPNKLIAWKSLEGSAVQQAGDIRFEPVDGEGTRVDVHLSYNPPAGVVGHAVATLFARDPKQQMDDDLARLKTTIEAGQPPRDAAATR